MDTVVKYCGESVGGAGVEWKGSMRKERSICNAFNNKNKLNTTKIPHKNTNVKERRFQ